MTRNQASIHTAVLALLFVLVAGDPVARATDVGTPDTPAPGPEPEGTPAQHLVDVGVDVDDGSTVVTLEGDGGFRYSTFAVDEPRRFVVDLAGVVNLAEPYSSKPERGSVRQVRVAQHRLEPTPVTRVVVDLGDSPFPALEQGEERLRLRWEGEGVPEPATAPAANAKKGSSPIAPTPALPQPHKPISDPGPSEKAFPAGMGPVEEDDQVLLAALQEGRATAAAEAQVPSPGRPQPPRVPSTDDRVAEAVQTWQETGDAPTILRSTTQQVPYGHTQPMLRCSPNRACDIELQAGEVVYGVALGAPDKWTVQQLASGDPQQPTPHVVVQPVEYDSATNIVIGTDKRVYHVGLYSPPEHELGQGPDDYQRSLSFYYPDQLVQQWRTAEAVQEALAQRAAQDAARQRPQFELGASVERLNFDYEVDPNRRARRKASWIPVSVFDDETRTYIRLPSEYTSTTLPSILVQEGSQAVVPNYHYEPESHMIVLHTIIDEALLFTGTGRKRLEVRIEATR